MTTKNPRNLRLVRYDESYRWREESNEREREREKAKTSRIVRDAREDANDFGRANVFEACTELEFRQPV